MMHILLIATQKKAPCCVTYNNTDRQPNAPPTGKLRKQKHQQRNSCQKQIPEDSDDSSTTSSCWGRSKDSLGFEYWLEDSDDFFEIDVF
jgi:hypothetical protein